jgi:predicted DNA-binding ribbon-helix-helix protein
MREMHELRVRFAEHEGQSMKSPILKRSIVIGGHKTSVSLEDAFWRGLKEIARAEGVTLSHMVNELDKSRVQSNLSSAIRLFVLDRLRVSLASFPAAADGRARLIGVQARIPGDGHGRAPEHPNRAFRPAEPTPA